MVTHAVVDSTRNLIQGKFVLMGTLMLQRTHGVIPVGKPVALEGNG